MLRITIYSMLIVILTMGPASAQSELEDLQGGQNSLRTRAEKKNDKEVDRAYRSTVKRLPDAEKTKSDPWSDVRSAPSAAAKNKQ